MGMLKGRGAVVTGGGRGIGAATARALAAEGAAVVVTARSRAEIDAMAAELRAAGARAAAIECDVADEASVARMAAAAEEFLGSVDIVVANAGIATSQPLKAIRVEEWNRVFAVNVTGVMLTTRAFAPAMAQRGWGRVVVVASIAGLSGAKYIATYSASKHAVIGFTRCVAAELAPSGATCNAICPGYVDTAMTDQSVERVVAKTGLDAEIAKRHILETNPQGRLLTAEEIAGAALFLCSPAAAGINGQALAIDGGAVLA